MKNIARWTAAVAALALVGTALAEPDQNSDKQKKWKPGQRFGTPEERQILTPEERRQLREAMAEVKDDPAIIEARKRLEEAHKAMREAMRAALLKADPSLEPILDKIKDVERPLRRPGGPFGGPGGRPGPPPPRDAVEE